MIQSNHEEWLEYADMDKASADFLTQMHPMPFQIVAYHYQQASEKLLKAFLVSQDIEPPKVHDLLVLVQMCSSFDESFQGVIPAAQKLNKYAVHVKYPGQLELNEADIVIAQKNLACIEAKTLQLIEELQLDEEEPEWEP